LADRQLYSIINRAAPSLVDFRFVILYAVNTKGFESEKIVHVNSLNRTLEEKRDQG